MGVVAHFSLPIGDQPDAARGADLLKRRGPADLVQVLVVHPDGTQEAVPLSDAATRMVADLLEQASASGEVALFAGYAEVSAEDAAAILGIAQPLVRRRLDSGALPYRRAGADRWIRLADVLALKEREAPVRAALADLQADTDELTARGL